MTGDVCSDFRLPNNIVKPSLYYTGAYVFWVNLVYIYGLKFISMILKNYFLTAGIILWVVVSCKTAKSPSGISTDVTDTVDIVVDLADTLKPVSGEVDKGQESKPENMPYRPARTKVFKLIHTRLDLSFDLRERKVNGLATIELKPWFYPQQQLRLDAVGFEVEDVWDVTDDGDIKLDYDYDGKVLDIKLGKTLTSDQHIIVKIKYTARPENFESDTGNAIKSNQGLYFIDPEGTDPQKPTEIWTQGEVQSNSHWFPTIDAPNQRCTQEMFITVDKKFVTLSNGILVYSRDNPDSTRTDYWKMDKPHAPYLFMLAVGEYAVVKDKWRGMDVSYYVEPEYEQYARDIFGRTPEMIGYFSDLLDYPFPWPKYAQVVVRDFVTGAMENTTATVFMDDVQVTRRELVDDNWDDIIAHELFHQWFGDLVTCESWANIVLNEGFATYAEYLWKDYKYGHDEAAEYLKGQLDEYLNEAETKKVSLIRYRYNDPDDLFDNHSYEKGSVVLHLLRTYIGDDAFFKSIQYYLKKYQFNSVEINDLRMAFEEVTGRDLKWFFNQWYLAPGHPVLDIKKIYVDSLKQLTLQVRQQQDTVRFPVFRLPVKVDVWVEGNRTSHKIVIDKSVQKFTFTCDTIPDLLLFDTDFAMVGEIKQKKTPEEWYYQYVYYDKEACARAEVIDHFSHQEESDSIGLIILKKALEDPYWSNRFNALWALENFDDSVKILLSDRIIALSEDPYPYVRAQAIAMLEGIDSSRYVSIYARALDDSSLTVVGTALDGYLHSGTPDAPEVAERFLGESNFYVVVALANYFIEQGDYTHLKWFTQALERAKPKDLWYFISYYGWYLAGMPDDEALAGAKKLAELAKNSRVSYVRGAAYQALSVLENIEGVPEMLAEIRKAEKDPQVRMNYMGDQ